MKFHYYYHYANIVEGIHCASDGLLGIVHTQ